VNGPGTSRETTISISGIDLFIRERGEGFPLLMLNGLGANNEMWGPAEEQLSKFARTIVFEAPGCGRSSTPLRPRSMRELARIVSSLLDELGHDQADVLGLSLGGVLAQQLARADPKRIRRLALVATACGWGSMPGTLPALSLLAMPLRYYSRFVYEQTNRLVSDAEGGQEARLRRQADARLAHPPSFLGYAYQVWAGMLWSSLTWLPEITVPTLVVAGDTDRLVPPANSVQLARLLPNSRLQRVPGEGHMLLFDPEGKAHPLLESYFSSKTLESSAWTTGTQVTDDAEVTAAFNESVGGEPFRSMSGAFRWLAQKVA
jgi:pimeloyl-ACP methyl ester carboxylesterase